MFSGRLERLSREILHLFSCRCRYAYSAVRWRTPKKAEVPSDFRFSNYIFDYQSMSEAWGIRTPDNLIKRHPLECVNHAVLRHLMDKKWTCYFLYKSYTVHTY